MVGFSRSGGASVLAPENHTLPGRARMAMERMKELVRRLPVPRPWMVVAALLLGEWVVDYKAAMIADHNGWQFYNGGDGSWYYTTTTVLAHGHIPQATLGYGYSLLLAPIVHFAGPNAMLGLPGIVLFNQLVLVPIALLCVYGIATMIGGRWFALFAGVAWVVFPVAAIHYFLPDYHERYVDMQLPPMIGVTGQGDYPSMVLLLVAAYFVLRFARFGRRLDALTSGLAAGFAIAVKPSNLLFLPAPLLVFLLARNPRALGLFAAAAVPSVIGLTIWKYRGLGYLPAFQHSPTFVALGAHVPFMANPTTSWFHAFVPLDWHELRTNYDELGGYTQGRWIITAAVVGGFIGLASRWFSAAMFAATWLASYVLIKGSSAQVDIRRGDFFNHMIAAFPAFVFLVCSCIFLVGLLGRRKARSEPVGPPEHVRLRLVPAGVLGAITAIGLIVVVTLPPLTTPAEALVNTVSFVVPANTFSLSATRSGASRVTLEWPKQHAIDGDFSYAVFRDPIDELSCTRILRAASSCVFNGTQVASVPGTANSWIDRSAGRKPSTYYVAFSSTPGQPQYSSDYLMLSRPASVAAIAQE